ncbi:hypothetical protein OOG41_08630 [Bacillus sp. AS_5]|uniref:hypothetical protein n=1 Tax=unclassified Bacillus (in: firmicutes) TaxID=185979 RepID=UPI00224957E3|nr:hypothetical protein [Bacillus sp. AS_3]MCW4655803.1 hypothetical protein [Bacillus sp. AS_3]MCX2701174.1 hypothetical protein [Bacillus sp. AS_5]
MKKLKQLLDGIGRIVFEDFLGIINIVKQVKEKNWNAEEPKPYIPKEGMFVSISSISA